MESILTDQKVILDNTDFEPLHKSKEWADRWTEAYLDPNSRPENKMSSRTEEIISEITRDVEPPEGYEMTAEKLAALDKARAIVADKNSAYWSSVPFESKLAVQEVRKLLQIVYGEDSAE